MYEWKYLNFIYCGTRDFPQTGPRFIKSKYFHFLIKKLLNFFRSSCFLYYYTTKNHLNFRSIYSSYGYKLCEAHMSLLKSNIW